jgi:hypothetical protein
MQAVRSQLVSLGVFQIASTLLLLGNIQVVAAAPETRIACGQCEETDRFVRLQAVTEDRRSANSRAFTHPFVLSPEDWTSILSGLRVQRQAEGLLFRDPPGPVIPAFTTEEIGYLSTTLSRAFARAQPPEWVLFGLSRPTPLGMTEVTTGGWFVEGPSLHLVLANYHKVVTMPSTRQLLWQRPLRPDAGPAYDLVAGHHQTIVRDSGGMSWLFSSPPSELRIAYQAILLEEPGETPVSQRSSVPSSETPSSALSLEDRLRVLKQLQEQGLITDEDYRAKKQQLLERF